MFSEPELGKHDRHMHLKAPAGRLPVSPPRPPSTTQTPSSSMDTAPGKQEKPFFVISNKSKAFKFSVPDSDEAEHQLLRECLLSGLGKFGEMASSIEPNVRSCPSNTRKPVQVVSISNSLHCCGSPENALQALHFASSLPLLQISWCRAP
jgi:hypothetical protein